MSEIEYKLYLIELNEKQALDKMLCPFEITEGNTEEQAREYLKDILQAQKVREWGLMLILMVISDFIFLTLKYFHML